MHFYMRHHSPVTTTLTLMSRFSNSIGNLLVPNDNYCKFEDWVMPILDKMLVEQREKVCLA